MNFPIWLPPAARRRPEVSVTHLGCIVETFVWLRPDGQLQTDIVLEHRSAALQRPQRDHQKLWEHNR